MRVGPLLPVLVAVAACGPQRPVVYLGEQPTTVARDRAAGDVEACLAAGEQYRTGTGKGTGVARDTAVGGAAGGAAGAAGGAIAGAAGPGAATGAAVGATWAFMGGLLRPAPPDPGFRGAVERCLADRGQRVVAWR